MANYELQSRPHLVRKFLDYAKCADCSYSESKHKTIDFQNRFKILAYQPDTVNGFSATLFKDTFNQNQKILAICGTEGCIKDMATDTKMSMGEVSIQCYELARFYEETIRERIGNEKLIVVGHSLGGYLAQAFCFMYPSAVKECYTYNSPGLLQDMIKTMINIISYTNFSTRAIKFFSDFLESKTDNLRKYEGVIERLKANINTYTDRLPYPLNKSSIHHIRMGYDFTTFVGNNIQGECYDIDGDILNPHSLDNLISELQKILNK